MSQDIEYRFQDLLELVAEDLSCMLAPVFPSM